MGMERRVALALILFPLLTFAAFACGGASTPPPPQGCGKPFGNYKAQRTVVCEEGFHREESATVGFTDAPDGGLQVTFNGEEAVAQRQDCRVVASIRVYSSPSGNRSDTLDLLFSSNLSSFSGTETLDLVDVQCGTRPDGGRVYAPNGVTASWTGTKL